VQVVYSGEYKEVVKDEGEL